MTDEQVVIVKGNGCLGCVALLLVLILGILTFPLWFPVLLGLIGVLWTL